MTIALAILAVLFLGPILRIARATLVLCWVAVLRPLADFFKYVAIRVGIVGYYEIKGWVASVFTKYKTTRYTK